MKITVLALLFYHLYLVCHNSLLYVCSHFTITHKPWVWKFFLVLSECMIGTSTYCWWYQASQIIYL